MPSQSRPSYYTLSTTDGRQVTIYVAPDDDPWQAATQYARASFASDSQLAALRIASQAEIAALTAQLEVAPEPGSGANPTSTPPAAAAPPAPPAQPPRGAKVNAGRLGRGPKDHPTWATGPQRETWRSRVLLVWDHDLQRIVGLSAKQALDLIAHLQSCDQWPQEGIVVGTPMTRLALNQPDRPPQAVLVDQIELAPAETAALLDLLRSHEDALHAQAEAEEADSRRRLGQVYTLLLNAAARRRAKLAGDATEAEQPSG
jgi:hypothetical protein